MPPESRRASSISSTVRSFVVDTNANAPDAATLVTVLAATTSLGKTYLSYRAIMLGGLAACHR